MDAHRYTLNPDDYAAPVETWVVHTTPPTGRPLGTRSIGVIYTRDDPDRTAFTVFTVDRMYVGTCTNLIAAADLLFDVDRAMSPSIADNNDAFIAGVVAGADR